MAIESHANARRLFAVPIYACEDWTTNAALIATVHELGYINDTDTVLDMTYGRGGWWQLYRPAHLTGHDLDLDGVDSTRLLEADGSIDVICIDPPYIETSPERAEHLNRGTDFLDRYGLDDGPEDFPAMWTLIAAFLREAARVVKPGGVVLIKSMNYQSGRRFRPVTMMIAIYAEALGLDIDDELIHRRNPGPGTWDSQNVARRNTSTLLVLRRRRRKPRSGTTAAHLRFIDVALAGARDRQGATR